MNEEDTYKKLKGLTPEEAWSLRDQVFEDTFGHLPEGAHISDRGFNIYLEHLDKALAPYGWDHTKLYLVCI